MEVEREKSLEREMRAFHWVRMLAELPGRGPGTPEEREAAARIDDWLRELGFDEVGPQSARAQVRASWIEALHFGLAALGCALGGALGVVLAGVAAYSFGRRLRARESLLERGLRAPSCIDVIGRAGSSAPSQRVVLCAEIDAREPGWIFSDFLADFNARRVDPSRTSPSFWTPARVAETLLFAAAGIALARWLGASGFWIGAAAMSVGVALAVAALAAVAAARRRRSPGANDNASGVAAMLTCAEQLLALLPAGVELWVVAAGAGAAGGSGMRAFVDAHRDWSREQTLFIHFKTVGGGALHYLRREGPLGDTAHFSQVAELARRIAASGMFGEITPVDWPEDTLAGVAARAGFPALALLALEADGLPRNKRGASDLPASIDTETLIRSADCATAVVRAALRGDAGPIALL